MTQKPTAQADAAPATAPELSIRHYAAPGGECAVQLRKPHPNEFTPEKQEAFFAHLSETANNAASAREAGISPETARTWRRNNADFRARWERSLAEGHADLQMKLLAVALFGSTSTTVTTCDDAGVKTVKRTGDHPEIMVKVTKMNEVAVEAARVREAEELRIAGQPPLEKIWTLIDQMRSRGAALLEAPSSKAGAGAGAGGAVRGPGTEESAGGDGAA